MEYYDRANGIWYTSGGERMMKGEDMTGPLQATYYPTSLEMVEVAPGRMKLLPVRQAWDDSRFKNDAWLAPLASQARSLRLPQEVPGLDSTLASTKIRNFKGEKCLDFNIRAGACDIHDDLELSVAVMAPLRDSQMSDRISRSMPHQYVAYDNPHRWDLVRLMQRTEDHFSDHYIGEDEPVAIPSELEGAWRRESMHHRCLQKIFVESHMDLRESLYMLKMLTNAFNGKANNKQEHYTMMDGKEGSTAKGTIRALMDAVGGLFNGLDQRGYCSVMSLGAMTADTSAGDAPSEKFSNLHGCFQSFIDDFSATDQMPVSNEKLRQVSGLNNLSPSRKHKADKGFVYWGLLTLLVNGLWIGDAPFFGADLRRLAGQLLEICYMDEPKGDNQRPKDPSIKSSVGDMVSEFVFLAMAMHWVRQCREDAGITLPRSPSCIAFRAEFKQPSPPVKKVVSATADAVLKRELSPQTVSLPDSSAAASGAQPSLAGIPTDGHDNGSCVGAASHSMEDTGNVKLPAAAPSPFMSANDIEIVIGQDVELVGLLGQPEFNGNRAVVLALLPTRDPPRVQLRMEDGSDKCIKPCNIIAVQFLDPGRPDSDSICSTRMDSTHGEDSGADAAVEDEAPQVPLILTRPDAGAAGVVVAAGDAAAASVSTKALESGEPLEQYKPDGDSTAGGSDARPSSAARPSSTARPAHMAGSDAVRQRKATPKVVSATASAEEPAAKRQRRSELQQWLGDKTKAAAQPCEATPCKTIRQICPIKDNQAWAQVGLVSANRKWCNASKSHYWEWTYPSGGPKPMQLKA